MVKVVAVAVVTRAMEWVGQNSQGRSSKGCAQGTENVVAAL